VILELILTRHHYDEYKLIHDDTSILSKFSKLRLFKLLDDLFLLLVCNSLLLLLSTCRSLHKERILLLVELSLVRIQEIAVDVSIIGCLLENIVVV
jgi:hypothetical protein